MVEDRHQQLRLTRKKIYTGNIKRGISQKELRLEQYT